MSTNTVNTTTKSLGQLVKEALGPTEKPTPPTYEALITRAKNTVVTVICLTALKPQMNLSSIKVIYQTKYFA